MHTNLLKWITVSSIALGAITINESKADAAVDSTPVQRIQGDNRFETAALISSNTYESSDTVIIANARDFADALAGVPLAYQKDAPILLAQGNSLRAETIKEIDRLGAKNVIILGGLSAVNEKIESSLKSKGLTVTRLAGENRFETAEVIANELTSHSSSDKAIVVDGYNFADAMSVAPFAAREGMPIYLTRSNRLVSEKALEQFSHTYVIGGTTAVSKAVENKLNNPTRIEGPNRYATNIAVMDYFGINSDHLFVSTGLDFVDALTGAVFAAKESTGVALVKNNINNDLNNFVKEKQFSKFTILGGILAVPETVHLSLSDYLENKEYSKEEVKIENEVPFTRVETVNDQLPLGEVITHQIGSKGYDEVVYEVTYVKEKVIEVKEVTRHTFAPVDEIVEIGTQVTVTKEESEIENIIEFDNIEREDDTLPIGEQDIVQQGENGYDEVTYEVTYINSIENDRKEINRIQYEPINQITNIGTMKLTDNRTALNGLSIQITNFSYVNEGDFNTFSITYKETNNTQDRIDQDSFKLYLTDGSSHRQFGFFNSLMPGQSAERTYRFELLKTEIPAILEYGDVFFNESPQKGNPLWNVTSVKMN